MIMIMTMIMIMIMIIIIIIIIIIKVQESAQSQLFPNEILLCSLSFCYIAITGSFLTVANEPPFLFTTEE